MSSPFLPRDLNRDSLRYRYALARALYHGQEWKPDQPRRPRLPSELVLYIFQLSGLPRRHPSPALCLPWLEKSVVGDEQVTEVTIPTGEAEIQDRLWCTTPPLSELFLEQIRKFRLRTLSRDQRLHSCTPPGNWSWFEIGILQRLDASESSVPSAEQTEVVVGGEGWGLSSQGPGGRAELNPLTGKPLRWRSHYNEYSKMEFKLHVGDGIGRGHEIWKHLRPGDRLGVWMNAQHSGWSCSGKYADIEVWEGWLPSWM
ncbi:hypothetical protein FRB95_005712 [Tulasnella sp. JGI-2019a]|nr:hypothetical protein FRB95_005712 [Tulasnella sp. JGI-2019a]